MALETLKCWAYRRSGFGFSNYPAEKSQLGSSAAGKFGLQVNSGRRDASNFQLASGPKVGQVRHSTPTSIPLHSLKLVCNLIVLMKTLRVPERLSHDALSELQAFVHQEPHARHLFRSPRPGSWRYFPRSAAPWQRRVYQRQLVEALGVAFQK